MVSRREFLAGTAALLTSPVSHRAFGAPAPLLSASSSIVTSSSNSGVVMGTMIEAGIFKNLALSLVSLQSATGYAYPAILDSNGYPKSTPEYNIFGLVYMPSNIGPSDQLVLKWKGLGSIQLARGAPGFSIVTGNNFISGSAGLNLTVTGNNPRVVFTFNSKVPSNVTLNFLAGGKFSNLSNLVLCRLADETAVDTASSPEDYLDDKYVAVYQALKPGVVRPMGWTNPNSGNVSQSRYVAPWSTSINVSSQRWVPSAWAGVTTGTNAYTCQAQPDATKTYVNGEMIQLQFGNANTSNAVTVNSGGRGSVTVLRGTGSATGLPPAAGTIAAGSLATLTYDAGLGAFLLQSGGQTPCIPYEFQIAFANRVNANFWCNFSSTMNDESISAVTTMVRDRLRSTLSAYFEYGNEIWNNTFPATDFARLKGAALGFPADNDRQLHGWFAMRHCQAMTLVSAGWAPRSQNQLKRVLAFQAFGSSSGISKYRLQGSDLNGGTFPAYSAQGNKSYNSAPNRPIDLCDVLSYATYYSGAQCTNFDANYISRRATGISDLLAAADDYASGVASKMTSAISFIEKDVRAGMVHGSSSVASQTLQGLSTNIYPTWEAVAANYSKSIECYEGGYEGWYPSTQACASLGIATTYGGPDGKIATLLNAFKMSNNFSAVVADQLTQFRTQKHSVRSAWLLVPGVNQWSLSTGDCFTSKYKSWQAVLSNNIQ